MKRFTIFLLVLLLSIGILPAHAMEADGIPYDTYGTWKGQGKAAFVTQKAVYEPSAYFTGYDLGAGPMQTPVDLASDGERLYILDSGRSRILVLDADYRLIDTLSGLQYEGESLDLSTAEGIFAGQGGLLYVADTGGGRVIILDAQGKVLRLINAPKSEIIPEGLEFRPIELAQDENGFLYVLSKGNYYGAMVFGKDGEFLGFFGASRVGGGVSSILSRFFDNLFGTNARREASARKLPFEFTDICYRNKFMYTVSAVTKNNRGQIKKLSYTGENILKSGQVFADEFAFGDRLQVRASDGSYFTNQFVSLAVDDQDFMYALDGKFGKIFIYDGECNLISVFGGGLGTGIQQGTFKDACDIELFAERLVVLDKTNASVTVFEPTEYGRLLHNAVVMDNNGDYEQAMELWRQISDADAFNQLAYRGLSNGYLMKEDYEQALHWARMGDDKDNYERAFEELRRQFLAENFTWIFTGIALALGALVAFLVYSMKHKGKTYIKNRKLANFFSVLLHPADAAYQIKYNAQGSVLLAGGTMLLFFVLRVAEITLGGFMYVSYNPQTYNSGLTFLGTTALALLWCLVNSRVCTLFEGKGSLREIVIVTGYSLLPQLIYSALFIVCSYILVYSEYGFLQILHTVAWVLTVIILLVGMSVIHEYGFGKSLKMTVVTILGMALVAFIVVLVLTLFQDLFKFVSGAIRELVYRYRG